MKKILIIGAGASGMLAAGTALHCGASVTLIDKNEKPARKVMITGKGRCNLTNNVTEVKDLISNVAENGRFLYSSFSSFMPADTMRLFESLGVPLKTERGSRVFPVSDKACDIVDALKKYASGAEYICGTVEKIFRTDAHIDGVELKDGRKFSADEYILATGGASYRLTGSDGDGYRFATSLSHTLTPVRPSLVPLIARENCCYLLQGLSLKNVTLALYKNDEKKPLYSELGEMLFTHFGISGPLVLSASAHIKGFQKDKYKVIIDLKPALQNEQLEKRIMRDFSENPKREFENSLSKLLPRKMIPVMVKNSGIPSQQRVNQITVSQRAALVRAIKNFTLHIENYHDADEAIITAGGVNVKEIDPKTMKSKIIDNLYFAGEVIDVDAYTGGFNLQIAFSTGYAAGKSSSEEMNMKTTIKAAIDGPSGAGKSTIAKLAAAQLGFVYVDTGALYRTVALNAIRLNADLKDGEAVIKTLGGLSVSLRFADGVQHVFLGDEDVSEKIRTPEVSMAASAVSAIPEVRKFLFSLQRDIADKNNCIMDGRDIGTVVLPDAQIKIFLTASPEERALRRYKELEQKGTDTTFDEVLKDVKQRDYNDSHRAVAPLKPSEDGVTVDTTGMTLEESRDTIIKIIREKIK